MWLKRKDTVFVRDVCGKAVFNFRILMFIYLL
ncbi:hypothetical protein [uncultured Polaribacter sp.]|nr:hypothetical protein [uncultured Polaribacter sp.]